KVNSLPSSLHDQLVARSGMTDCRLVCATSCLYMTRLLKTCIAGCNAARVDSSRIDIEAGLSKCERRRTPPDFCADTGPPAPSAITITTAEANPGRWRAMSFSFRDELPV